MLNYLSRRANPTPYINFMPPEMVLFGQDRMLEAIRVGRPELVAMVPKTTDEYGFPRGFGKDFGQDLLAWLNAQYAPLFRTAGRPTSRGQFIITVATPRQTTSTPAK